MVTLKRILIGILSLAASVALVWWLARSSMPPPSDAGVKGFAETKIRLRFGHNSPVDSALHLAAQRFADEMAQKSFGRVEVSIHPFQELGNDDQMLEMARQGRLDVVLIPTAKMSVAVPAMQLADLPFYFPSREALYRVLDGEPGRVLLDKLRPIGLEGIAFWENGFKHYTANRPIHTPDDFKGLKIRTMKSRIIMHHFKEMGATPILIDFHSTRQALVENVVDGQENPLVAIVGMKIHEVQSHLTLSNHGYLGYVLSVSAKVFQNLPLDLRTLLKETGRSLVPFERAETQRREEQLLETIRRAGVTIHTLTEVERKLFAQSAEHIPYQFESVISPDVLSRAEELLRGMRTEQEKKHEIVVGFDSDLSTIGISSSLGIKQGALLAMKEINARGGVLGRRLVLWSRDDKAMPSCGIENFKDMASMPEVVAILGGVFSNVSELQAREAQQIGIPYLVSLAAAAEVVEHGKGPNYTFRVSANDRLAGPFLVQEAVKQFGRVALVLENSLWGRGNHESMQRFLELTGRTPTHVAWINRGEHVGPSMLEEIRRSGAQGIVLVANTMEGASLVQAMARDLTWGKKPLPIISHWGIVSGDFWSLVRPLHPGINLQVLQTFSFTFHPKENSERVLNLYRTFFNETGGVNAPVAIAQAYDLIHLLAQAIIQAGTTERKAVRDALESLAEYPGLIKRYNPPFTPDRHDALNADDYFLARFNQDGQLIGIDR
ncbi:MAG: DctP family TRAP transporter solute-binding subunit [Magnetococcales bacterium]|nr:DctP family TRAP transporter solute-binding subunit [Magnetococcales bacterium]MBF0148847.1 DctP family TRAP transporter solute-binding subunit [Magnetococcales bacterium]MBF0173153.1 DctP family TRAP transporter solute-binding subunit [Magnetococcales bacterium]